MSWQIVRVPMADLIAPASVVKAIGLDYTAPILVGCVLHGCLATLGCEPQTDIVEFLVEACAFLTTHICHCGKYFGIKAHTFFYI